jgi:hypothetical protein
MDRATDAPLEGRARTAVRALQLVIVVDVLVAVDDLVQARMLERAISDPAAVSDDRLLLRDSLAAVAATTQLVTFLLAAVLFLRWYHRAYRNLEAFGHEPDRSPAWAVGSWFVPFVNLVVPKRCVNEIWRAGTARDDHPAVLNVWWGAWIVAVLLSGAAARQDGSTLEAIRTAHLLDVAVNATDIVAAVLAIVVVRLLTRRQRTRHEDLARPFTTAESVGA